MIDLSHFSQPVFVTSDHYDLELLVKPDTDFDTAFQAVCAMTGDVLRINGWLFTVEENA